LNDLKCMAVFVDVVDLGSLAAAAERHEISPTMAGNHLRALEEKLGSTLLNRTTRRHSLTDIGKTYYEQARNILHLVAQANAGAQAMQSVPRGRLRVTAPVSFGAERLSPALGRFLAAHPEVTIELALNDRVVDLVDEGFDAAIRIGTLADSSLIGCPLKPYRMWICAAPAYLQRYGTPVRPDDLADHECLSFSYAGAEWHFGSERDSQKLAVKGRLQANSGQALRMAARSGLGIIMQPQVLLAEDVTEGRLVRLLADFELPGRPMQLVYLRDRHMSSKLRAFIDFIVDEFR